MRVEDPPAINRYLAAMKAMREQGSFYYRFILEVSRQNRITSSIGTVFHKIGLLDKSARRYTWVGSEPSEEMATTAINAWREIFRKGQSDRIENVKRIEAAFKEKLRPMTKDEQFASTQAEMPDEELCRRVSELTNPDKWVMTVPPRPTDSDMLIQEIVRRYRKILGLAEYFDNVADYYEDQRKGLTTNGGLGYAKGSAESYRDAATNIRMKK